MPAGWSVEVSLLFAAIVDATKIPGYDKITDPSRQDFHITASGLRTNFAR
ncbi:hypothetical protein OPIT5_22785 [Opitutaceae bacterium TAV5]|nr:hypothetical protein OPIT5_22785 [Opitutaceae bacterium TAV5]